MGGGGGGGILSATLAHFAIGCRQKAGRAPISPTSRIPAAITASAPGRGASAKYWSFCTHRFSFAPSNVPRRHRTTPSRPSALGHRPLQLSLHVLHVARDLRS